MIRSVIVLGGAGFLGKKIISGLINAGFKNIACGDIINPHIDHIEFYSMDILNGETLLPLKKFEVVINCTGQITNPIENCIMQNTIGINNIIKSLNNKSHLVHLSSVGVYGTVSNAIEECPMNPETAYSTSKAVADIFIQKNCSTNRNSIFRLCNLYGTDQPKGVISYLHRSFLTDRELFFEHDGSMERFFLHTDDCVKTIIRFVSQVNIPFGIFNLASEEKYSIRELISRIEKIKKIKYNIQWGDQKPWENIEILPSNKINRVLMIKHSFSLMDFIDKTFKNRHGKY